MKMLAGTQTEIVAMAEKIPSCTGVKEGGTKEGPADSVVAHNVAGTAVVRGKAR